jgi:hypothetical protein
MSSTYTILTSLGYLPLTMFDSYINKKELMWHAL